MPIPFNKEMSMTIQQFANEEFDEQKVNRHEVRQVLRGVRRISPEDWVEARRQRAAARTEQAADEAKACPVSTLQ